MKKLFLTFLLLALCLTLVFSVSLSAFAEESTIDIETTETLDSEDTTGKIAELIGKVNAYMETSDGYFATTILPLIIGCGSSLTLCLGLLIPYIKKSAKYKALLSVLKSQNEEIQKLQTLLTSTDANEISKALNTILDGKLANAINNSKIDNTELSEFKVNIKTIMGKLDSLIKGAQNAWACSSEAVKCLASVPELSILEEHEKKIKKLENYVRDSVGEEKLKEIEK